MACALLVVLAAAAALPSVSASESQNAPIDQPIASVQATGSPDPAAIDQVDQAAAGATDPGDGYVYNVMQAVDVPAGSGDFQIYVVVGGDTLAKIGARFSISRNSVYWANTTRLPDPSALSVRQKLVIPPGNGVTVTVRAGNTLSTFASRYKVSVQSIIQANGLTGTSLTKGQLLLVPVNPVPAIPAAKCISGCGGTNWNGGRLRWPVPASRDITQYFSRSHPAIDIGAPMGSAVIAAVGGKVIWAGWKYSGPGYGGGIEVWVVSGGGRLYTTYNHLSREIVRVGQIVAAGQRIGNVGMTGNATGPHLHFETWVCYPWTGGGTSCARNPLAYL